MKLLDCSVRSLVVLALAAGAQLLVASAAYGQAKDAEVLQVAASAREQAWEGMYPEATNALKKALKTCGRGGAHCSSHARAALHGDLGVLYVLQNNMKRARATFKAAIQLDPTLVLEGQLVTDEAQNLFTALGGSRPIALLHAPVTQQTIGFPIPIYAELSQPNLPASASVFYRGEAEARWRTAPMERLGNGYAATLPCQVTRRPGRIWYYVAANVTGGRAPLQTAPLEQPHVIEVTMSAVAPAPQLPGQAPPGRCQECYSDQECPTGQACQSGACVSPQGDQPKEEEDDEKGASASHGVWVGLGFLQELASASSDAPCTKESQLGEGLSCFRPQGSQYHGTPATTTAISGMTTTSGRALIASEIVLSDALSLGLRAGYALWGHAPRSDGGEPYLPFFGEARLAYWLGPGALTDSSAFFVFGAVGIAEVDPSYSVDVAEDLSVPAPPFQLDNPPMQTLTAYRRMGSAFGGAGAGVFFPIGSATALLFDGKVMMMFPSSGLAFSLGGGVLFGL